MPMSPPTSTQLPLAPMAKPKRKSFLGSLFSLAVSRDSIVFTTNDAESRKSSYTRRRTSSLFSAFSKVLFRRNSPTTTGDRTQPSRSSLSKYSPVAGFRSSAHTIAEEASEEEEEQPTDSPMLFPVELEHDYPELLDLLTDRVGNRQVAASLIRVARSAEACRSGTTARICRSSVCSDDEPVDDDDGGLITAKFRGEKRPKIALERYLARLVRYIDAFGGCTTNASDEDAFPGMGLCCVLGAAVLIDRLKTKHVGTFHLDDRNTHRLFMIGSLVAFKLMADDCCTNEYFAGVAGVSLKDINRMEVDLLLALDFQVNLSSQDFQALSKQFGVLL